MSERTYDFADLIVSLQRKQNKVMLEGNEAIDLYRYFNVSDIQSISDSCTISIDNRARYDFSNYNNAYFA